VETTTGAIKMPAESPKVRDIDKEEFHSVKLASGVRRTIMQEGSHSLPRSRSFLILALLASSPLKCLVRVTWRPRMDLPIPARAKKNGKEKDRTRRPGSVLCSCGFPVSRNKSSAPGSTSPGLGKQFGSLR
jgi:hypothetical protein